MWSITIKLGGPIFSIIEAFRDNSHIYNIDEWMSSLKKHWDEWTSFDHYAAYGAKDVMTLEANQYLSDIWGEIYWRSQSIDGYSALE